jgi:hypothetical protein
MRSIHEFDENATENVAACAGNTGATGRFDLKNAGLALMAGLQVLGRVVGVSKSLWGTGMKCLIAQPATCKSGKSLPNKLALSLTLCGVLGMSGGAALAKSSALNPAKLGPFCPPGSELADAKHTNLISVKEQAQIKKIVQGFMVLDATARRSVGHPLGSDEYWKKGYTAKFDVSKDVPGDGLRYIAYRYSNTCVNQDGAIATILLDVADLSGRSIKKIFQTPHSFVSPQSYWDAFSKTAITLPDERSSPDQPIIFTVLPLYKSEYGNWLIEQKNVPLLRKFIKTEWQDHIADISKAHKCNALIPRDQGACELNETNKQVLMKYSRPAWSIFPH